MRRRWTAVFALAWLAAGPTEAQPRRSLAGRWTITLETDSRPDTSPVAALTGSLVVVAVAGVDPPTFRGNYQIPFSTARLGPDAAPLLARTRSDDSVRVILDPSGNQGLVELFGVWQHGVVTGRWQATRREPKLTGQFTMRLESRRGSP